MTHSPMRRLRSALLLSDIPDSSYEESISSKTLDNGTVNEDQVVVKGPAIAEALQLLQQADEGGELFVELIISPLAPEERGYKKSGQGAAALQQLLQQKLQG